ncbi:MAG: DUF4837 family protein [Hyphomicrobiales bacterium]
MRRLKQLNLFAIILFVFIGVSCERTKKFGKESSIGKTNEILVVTNNADQWDGAIGNAVKETFGADIQTLPQAEPKYNLLHIGMSRFKDVYLKNRNILILRINRDISEPVVESRRDVWNTPQIVVEIQAPTQTDLIRAFDENQEGIQLLFSKNERTRILLTYKRLQEPDVVKAVEKHMGIKMLIPQGFYVAKEDTNFIWLRRVATAFNQEIIIYTQPYYSEKQLSPNYIIQERDSITKKYIPGEMEGSFMMTERRKNLIPPVSKNVKDFNNHYAVETRGLWKVFNDFMGGPFLNYTVIDEKHNRVVTIDGFVYAPNKNKRDYLKQLEAVMYSMEFIDMKK